MKFFTPGPSELMPSYRKYLDEALDNNIGSTSHRGNEFREIMKNTIFSLKKLMNIPEEYHIFFLSSANEAMERVIQSLVETKSVHLVEGEFGKKWFNFSKGYGKEAIALSNLDNMPESDLICVTHNETSNGLLLDLKKVYENKVKNQTTLFQEEKENFSHLIKDKKEENWSTSETLKREYACLFSVQKGFGMPAGLSVLIINDKCLQRAKELEEKNIITGPYHGFSVIYKKYLDYQTIETPNVLAIYILNKICEEFLAYGLDNIRKEIDENAKTLYNYFDNQTKFPLLLKERRSPYLLVLEATENEKIINYMKNNGIVIGTGYGVNKKDQLRIPNFFAHKKEDVEKLIKLFRSFSF